MQKQESTWNGIKKPIMKDEDCEFWHNPGLTYVKGGLISKSFSRWLQSSKNAPNPYPELYPDKEKILRIVLGTFFGKLEPKWKTF